MRHIKVPMHISFPYRLGKRTFEDGIELEKYINFAYAAGRFMPQWDKRKLVPEDEWTNEFGQKISDIELLQKMEARKPAAKAKASTGKSTAKDKVMADMAAHLNAQGFGKLYQDTPVAVVAKHGVRIRTASADYVVKVVAKKDPVARVAVGLKDTKANAFKNRVVREIVSLFADGMIVKGGVVTAQGGKDYVISVTKKSARVD